MPVRVPSDTPGVSLMTVFSYLCPVPGLPLEQQRQLIADYCSRVGLEPGEVLQDADAEACCVPLGWRPGGTALLGRARSADAVVVASPLAIGPRREDALGVLRHWHQAGVVAHIADVGNGASLSTEGE